MDNKTRGQLISTLRKEKGMTQADLAAEMNVTDKAVSKWERDLSCPDINSLPKLAELLGITVEELINSKPGGEKEEGKKAEDIVGLILRAVPLAMGVAVVVTSILGELETSSGFIMAGIAIACMAVDSLRKTGADNRE